MGIVITSSHNIFSYPPETIYDYVANLQNWTKMHTLSQKMAGLSDHLPLRVGDTWTEIGEMTPDASNTLRSSNLRSRSGPRPEFSVPPAIWRRRWRGKAAWNAGARSNTSSPSRVRASRSSPVP